MKSIRDVHRTHFIGQKYTIIHSKKKKSRQYDGFCSDDLFTKWASRASFSSFLSITMLILHMKESKNLHMNSEIMNYLEHGLKD